MDATGTTAVPGSKRLSVAGERNARAKLTWQIVEQVRALYAGSDNATAVRIARELGISPRQVRRVLRGENWVR